MALFEIFGDFGFFFHSIQTLGGGTRGFNTFIYIINLAICNFPYISPVTFLLTLNIVCSQMCLAGCYLLTYTILSLDMSIVHIFFYTVFFLSGLVQFFHVNSHATYIFCDIGCILFQFITRSHLYTGVQGVSFSLLLVIVGLVVVGISIPITGGSPGFFSWG